MQFIILTVSSVLTLASVIPYILEILRGKTKPRIVSWITWTLLTGIAAAASFADGQVPAAVLATCCTIATASVVLLGYRKGDRSLDKFDIVCMGGVVVGLILWLVFNSPAIAVLAAVTIDLVGALPTIRHSWQKPHEETAITFAVSSLAAGLTLAVAGDWRITAVAYPIYLVAINVIVTTVILLSPHRRLASVDPEPRVL
jgi:hypothetical protein